MGSMWMRSRLGRNIGRGISMTGKGGRGGGLVDAL